MTKLFVSYDIALKLKEKGFNEKCITYYTADSNKLTLVQGYNNLMFADYVHLSNTIKSIPCPLYQQVIDWFDDIHKIRIDLTHSDSTGKYNYTIWKWNFDNNIGKWERISCLGLYSSKEERNINAINHALTLI